MGASKTSELQIFSSGMDVVKASHLIDRTESRLLTNVDTRRGTLNPFFQPEYLEETTGDYMYYYNGEYHYYNSFRSNVLYNKVWYWSDVHNSGKMYQDGSELPLGIAAPTNRLAISESAPSAGPGLTGRINYVYTYYDPASGSESPPSRPSNELVLLGTSANQAITIANIEPSPDGFKTRLYRIGGVITAYTAVIKLLNTDTQYTDELTFSEIEGVILDTLRAYPPLEGLNLLAEHQGRFFGAVDSMLYYSAAGKPDSWYALDYIGFEDTITSIISVANGLVVTTVDKTWVIVGTQPLSFARYPISESIGCVNIKSVASHDGKAIWLSRVGFATSNGSNVINLSLDKIGRFKSVEPESAAFLDNRYFMAFSSSLYPANNLFPSDDLLPNVNPETGQGLEDGAIVIDFTSGSPSFSSLADPLMRSLLVVNGDLQHLAVNSIVRSNLVTELGDANIVTESGIFNIVVQTKAPSTRCITFGNAPFREMKYVSPLLTEGSIGTLKQYEKIRIKFRGDFEVSAVNEHQEVLQIENLISIRNTSTWINIPVSSNRGNGIQFKIYGQGVIESLMYTWTPMEIQ